MLVFVISFPPKSNQNIFLIIAWVLDGELWVHWTKKMAKERNSEVYFLGMWEYRDVAIALTVLTFWIPTHHKNSMTIPVLEYNTQFRISTCFIFLNGIHTWHSLRTWRKFICFWKKNSKCFVVFKVKKLVLSFRC